MITLCPFKSIDIDWLSVLFIVCSSVGASIYCWSHVDCLENVWFHTNSTDIYIYKILAHFQNMIGSVPLICCFATSIDLSQDEDVVSAQWIEFWMFFDSIISIQENLAISFQRCAIGVTWFTIICSVPPHDDINRQWSTCTVHIQYKCDIYIWTSQRVFKTIDTLQALLIAILFALVYVTNFSNFEWQKINQIENWKKRNNSIKIRD